MSDDQFTKLFTHMNQRFDEVDARLDEKASQKSVDALTASVDGIVKRLDQNEIEQAARDAKFQRLTEWGHKVATKTNTPLKDL